MRGTRNDVLWQIERWLVDERDQRIFWLNGLAGTGKSAIAQTFAETSFADGKLGASFFCSRDSEDRRDIQNIFPTLAFQLAYRYPEFRKELLPVLKANPEIERHTLCHQLEKVIIGPFKATCIQTLIVIDALDECKDRDPASAILSVLSRYVDQIPHVKFFITGCPEPPIRAGFRLEPLRPITEVLKPHDVGRSSINTDIKLFLETRLTEIAKTRSDCDFGEIWPSPYDIDVLCKKSAGLFVYASTVVKFVTSPHDLPTERLTLIVSHRQSTAHEGRSGIDLLYTQVLEQAFLGTDSDSEERYSYFKLVVGAVLLAFYPLSRKTLSELLQECDTPFRISDALRSLHSLLLVPSSEIDPIHPFHKSFPDFLTDSRRCKDERFFVDPPVHHIEILFSCLGLMKERLRKNICDLNGCPLLSKVKDLPDRKKACIGDALEYACRFWTRHLSETRSSGPHVERVKAAIDEFFTTHLLFWIEVLSLMGHLDLGVYALHDIDEWYLSVSCVGYLSKRTLMYMQTGDSCRWTNDSQRLILSSFDTIRDAPINMYRHILPFCPSYSWFHKWYTPESLQEVKVVKGRPDRWGAHTRVVSFPHDANVLVFRKDIIAVGLSSGDITILDAVTGSSRSVLSGHTNTVMSLALTLDGTLLVSGSFDDTIKLWDVQTGGIAKTFHGQAHALSISPDALTIASGSTSGVYLWDIRTGKCRHIINTVLTSDRVTCLDFLSTVPGRLVYISGGLVRWRGTNGGETGPMTSGHHIAFSSDTNRFALCDEGPPTVRDTVSGTIIATLHSPGRDFNCCCFSPSDKLVAGIANTTVYVWDITGIPRLVETFTPDSNSIFSLAFSFSLVSMHSDGKLRFQQIDGDSPDSTSRNTESTEYPWANIIYTTLQAEGVAISLDLAGTVLRWNLSTGLPEFLLQIPETLKYVVGVRLTNGILIVVFQGPSGNRWKISTWDVRTGKRLSRKSLSGDCSALNPVSVLDRLERGPIFNGGFGVSQDGTTFFAVNWEEIRTWSITTGESTDQLNRRIRTPPSSTPFSIELDGPRIWVHSWGSPAWGCDLRNSYSPPFRPSDIAYKLRLVCLLATDGRFGEVRPITIVDTTSQIEVFRLPLTLVSPGAGEWDGRHLVVVSRTGKLLILDFTHMTLR